ncbi:MAG: OmpA family protein [bacterium]|nr:OmpA family protein [bacterium]
MKTITLLICLSCLAVIHTPVAYSQAIIPPPRIGVYGGLNLNFNSPSIKMWRSGTTFEPQFTPFVQDSLRITNGETVMAAAFGFIGAFHLTDKIHLSLRAGYNSLSTSASAEQTLAPTTVTHDFTSSMSALELSPVVEFYGLLPNVSLHPLVGLEFGIPLSGTYRHEATAVSQNTTTSQVFDDNVTVPNTSMRAALLLGVGYTFRLGDSWYLQPEVSYRIPLTSVSSASDFTPWKISQLRVGMNIMFGFSKKDDVVSSDKSRLDVGFDRVTTYDANGREVNVSQLSLEDVRYNEMFPLVPYVFTGENKTQPDSALQQGGFESFSGGGGFNPEQLPLDAIEVNRNLLNVVGARMKKYSNATLTVTGTTDGKTESPSRELAAARAAWAKNYLVNTSGIDASRIATTTTTTPVKPSSANDPDGIAENRRIELASNVPDVLAPLIITTDNQRVARPDVVVFHAKVNSDDSIRSWTLTVTQAGKVLREMSSRGRPTAITWAIKPNELSDRQVPVDYELLVRNVKGDSAMASASLPVEYFSSVRKKTENLPDRTIDKYSLILFDFDKSTLNEENARILEQMVVPSVRANSKVRIVGYTDRIGNDAYNTRLSSDRAETVMTFLKQRAKDATYTASGVGESSAIFNNDSPIGRQLSRTVQIIVETPHR